MDQHVHYFSHSMKYICASAGYVKTISRNLSVNLFELPLKRFVKPPKWKPKWHIRQNWTQQFSSRIDQTLREATAFEPYLTLSEPCLPSWSWKNRFSTKMTALKFDPYFVDVHGLLENLPNNTRKKYDYDSKGTFFIHRQSSQK